MNTATLKTGVTLALVAIGLLVVVPTVYGQRIGLQNLDRLTAGTPQQLERGEQVYDVQCAECHGDQGLGGAPVGERMGAQGFVDVEVERSGVKSIFSVITHGYEFDDQQHPVFENLRYQDRFAVATYVHSLIDDPQPDPSDIAELVRREAIEGRCDPDILGEVTNFIEPEDEAQIRRGEEVWQSAGCAGCHGADGIPIDAVREAYDPPARSMDEPAEDWTRGTSALALFETMDRGVEGTAMPPAAVPDEDKWALVHFMREELIPEAELQEVTEEEIEAVCRALSSPPDPQAIPIERAMAFMVEDYEAGEDRFLRHHAYGDPLIEADADPIRGQERYQQSCASCHGADGTAATNLGPYGKFPPYMYIEIDDLVPASVGGTYEEVARRVIEGPHAPLPERPSVAALTDRDWQDIQAFIATFEGAGSDRVRVVQDVEVLFSVDDFTLYTTEDGEDFQALRDWFEELDPPAALLQQLVDDAGIDPEAVESADIEALEEALEELDLDEWDEELDTDEDDVDDESPQEELEPQEEEEETEEEQEEQPESP